jgi:hypothetical protein
MAIRIIPPSGSQPSTPSVPSSGGGNFISNPVGNTAPDVQPSPDLFSTLLGGIGHGAHAVGNFFLPQTTKAFDSVRQNGLQSLNQQNPEPMNMSSQILGHLLSVLPGGSNGVYTQNTPLGGAGREFGSQVLANEGLNSLGSFMSPVLNPVKDFLRTKLPAQFVKLALPEGAALEKKAVESASRGYGVPLAEEIVNRGQIGTSHSLIGKANTELNLGKDAAGSVDLGTTESKLQSAIKNLPGAPETKSYIEQALAKVKERFRGSGADVQAMIDKTGEEISKEIGHTDTWQDLLKVRRTIDSFTGGDSESAAVRNAVKGQVADEFRTALSGTEEVKKLLQDEQFYIRMKNAAVNSASKPFISPGNLLALAGGGAGAAIGGPAGAAAGIAATKIPFSPGAMTILAQLLRGGGTAATSGAIPETAVRLLLNQLLNNGNGGEPAPMDTVPSSIPTSSPQVIHYGGR